MPVEAGVWRVGDQFPLRQPFRAADVDADSPSDVTTRPFGLGHLIEPPRSATVDLDPSAAVYDPETQLAWASDHGVMVPTSRHGGRGTKTQTQRDDKNAPDDDQDVGG